MKIFKFLLFSCLFINLLFSKVELKIPDNIIKGEALIFSIKIDGKEIQEMPNLSLIDGFSTQKIKNYSYSNSVNGVISRHIEYVYSLYPTKDIVFPELTFKIDSKVYTTPSKKITLSLPSKTKSKLFDLEIISEKNEVFLGEKFVLKVKLKYKKNSEIVDLSFLNPQLKDFWYTQLNNSKKYEKDNYQYFEIDFLLSALKKGLLQIEPFSIQAQVLDLNNSDFSFFTSSTKSLKIYSNKLEINVKELPANVSLIGNFEVSSSVNKIKIKKGEALSFKFKIEGNGNFDDIENIKLDLPNTTIYENKPKVETYYKNDKLFGSYEKVYSIISEEDFTIPKIEIKYFDKNLNQIVSKYTEEYKIQVEKTKLKNERSIKLEKSNLDTKVVQKIGQRSSIKDNILYFVLGAFFTILLIIIYKALKNKQEKEELDSLNIVKEVKKTKNKDELLKKIFGYIGENDKLDKLIFSLEKDIDFKDIKKEILQILKSLEKAKK